MRRNQILRGGVLEFLGPCSMHLRIMSCFGPVGPSSPVPWAILSLSIVRAYEYCSSTGHGWKHAFFFIKNRKTSAVSTTDGCRNSTTVTAAWRQTRSPTHVVTRREDHDLLCRSSIISYIQTWYVDQGSPKTCRYVIIQVEIDYLSDLCKLQRR